MKVWPGFGSFLGAVLLAALLAGLAGCVSLSPDEAAAKAKNRLAGVPAPNWFHVPENQPFIGDSVVFETLDGPTRYEVSVANRQRDTYRIKINWLATPPDRAYFRDLSYVYEVSLRSDVLAASLDDGVQKTSKPLKVAGSGEPGYVSQPSVMKLPVPEFIDTGKRKVRADAILVNEVRQGEGALTQIYYLSDEVKLGVAQVVTVTASSLSVSDVVGLVAAAGLRTATPSPLAAATPTTFSATLEPRLAKATQRSISKLVEP